MPIQVNNENALLPYEELTDMKQKETTENREQGEGIVHGICLIDIVNYWGQSKEFEGLKNTMTLL